MTSSPFLTLTGARSPLSRRLPSPTDRTLPRLGFSLAVSVRTIPDLVLDSASTRLTRILSPRGRSLGIVGLLLLRVIGRSSLVCFGWPSGFVVAAQHARQGIEEQVEVDGFGE